MWALRPLRSSSTSHYAQADSKRFEVGCSLRAWRIDDRVDDAPHAILRVGDIRHHHAASHYGLLTLRSPKGRLVRCRTGRALTGASEGAWEEGAVGAGRRSCHHHSADRGPAGGRRGSMSGTSWSRRTVWGGVTGG